MLPETFVYKAGLILNDWYDTTCMIQLVSLCKIANPYKTDVQIFVWYNFWKNRMSSISSNLYDGNGPITFYVSQCWIILKKNLI